MGKRRWISIAAVTFLVAVLLTIYLNLNKRRNKYFIEFKADGQGFVSNHFDEDNRQTLHIRSRELISQTRDQVVLKDIEATIYKKGRMDEDITVKGQRGMVENNRYNFRIYGQSRISSKNLLVESPEFTLVDRNMLDTKQKTRYKINTIRGESEKGLVFNIKEEILSFSMARGDCEKEGKTFQYQADLVRLFRQQQSLRLRKNAWIGGQEGEIKGDLIVIVFRDEMKKIAEVSSRGKSYLHMITGEGKQHNEITAIGELITNTYDDQEKLKQTTLTQSVELQIKSSKNLVKISTESLTINYQPDTGQISEISTSSPGRVDNKGPDSFTLSAHKIVVHYDKAGEVDSCEGIGACQFSVEQYVGTGSQAIYRAKIQEATIDGETAKLEQKSSSFTAPRFILNLDTKVLRALVPEDPQKKRVLPGVARALLVLSERNVLFTQEPIIIDSQGFTIDDRKNQLVFETKVQMQQSDVSLSCNRLEIREQKSVEASTGVYLRFKNGADQLEIKCERLSLDPARQSLEIENQAEIHCYTLAAVSQAIAAVTPPPKPTKGKKKQAAQAPEKKAPESSLSESSSDDSGYNFTLRANLIGMLFNQQNEIDTVDGEKEIQFVKEDMTGTAGKFRWVFARDEIFFWDNPQIQKTGSGATKGYELHFNLKTDEITVNSRRSRRAETIIEKKSPTPDKKKSISSTSSAT